jgi:PKD repeat protein
MKHYFLTTLFALSALLAWAQNTAVVSGHVYDASGAAVPHWLVYGIAGDSTQWDPAGPMPQIATAVTDNDGYYTFTLDLPAGFTAVTALTDNGCVNDQQMVLELATVTNGTATADFSICAEVQTQNPDCSVYFWYEPTADSLTIVLHPDFWALDGAAAASYFWDFGDGTTSTEANPTHAYATGGEYVVTLTVTSATGCEATTESFVWVGDQPPFPDCWSWVQVETVDSLTFEFSAQAFAGWFGDTVTAVGYQWDFGDGTTSTEANPTHTYAQHGIYDVTVIVTTADSCPAFGSFPLWTDLPPQPDCRAFIQQTPVDTTTFTFSAFGWSANGTTLDIASYNWDFGDGNTSSDSTPTHTYAEPGIYTVSLTGLTTDSCEVYACDIVMACDCPIDTFWYGCQAMFGAGYGFDPAGNPTWPPADPLTLSFWDMSLGAVATWAWDFGDGTTSTEQNPVHTYATDGIYTVTLSITTLDDCESTVSFEIYAGDDFPWIPEPDCQALFIPMPDSIGGTGIQFLDYSWSPFPITSWSWDFGDGTTSTEQNPYHVYNQPGVYTVSLTITGDSCNSVIAFAIDTDSPWQFADTPVAFGQSGESSATQEPQVFSNLRLAPNPATDAVTLAFQATTARDVELRLTDLAGRTVQTTRHAAQTGLNTLPVRVDGLTPGLYLAQLVTKDGVQAVKFVKE